MVYPSRAGVGPSRPRASVGRMDVAAPDCAPASQRCRRHHHTLYLYARRHARLRRDSLLRAVGAFGGHSKGGHGGSRGARPPWEGAEPTDGWSVTERTVESAPRWANGRHLLQAPCGRHLARPPAVDSVASDFAVTGTMRKPALLAPTATTAK